MQQSTGVGLIFMVLIPLAIAIAVTLARHYRQRNTTDSFFVANRNVGTTVIALSIASSWIWTVALFVIPQKTYELGAPALIPLIGVNSAALLLLAILVPRVREFCGNRQLTLPQFTHLRDGHRTAAVFTIGVLGVQIYSVITHMLGVALLLTFMPSSIGKETFVVFLAFAFLIVAWLRGLQSSIVMDIVKYAAVFGIALLGLMLTSKSGGVDVLAGGLMGLRPADSGLIPAGTVWLFVLPVSAGLLSAVAMDDQLYQRGFAAKKNPKRVFGLATLVFLMVPIGMSLLGLLAANKSLGVVIDNRQLVSFLTIQKLLPEFPMYLVVAAVMTALIGSGGSALHAAGNVGAKNVVHALWPSMDESRLVLASRVTMVVTLTAGTAAALIGIGIFELWMGWNMFRAVLFFPIVALIMTSRESVPSVFGWIVVGLPVTLSAFAFFIWLGEPAGVASGEAILVAWGTTLAMWTWHSVENARSVQKEMV